MYQHDSIRDLDLADVDLGVMFLVEIDIDYMFVEFSSMYQSHIPRMPCRESWIQLI